MSFPEYSEYKYSGISWIGYIPSEWKTWKIAHAFNNFGSGTTPPTSDPKWFSEGTIPWVTTGELRETTIAETRKLLIPEALEEFSALEIHPVGSLVMAMYGATIGRLGILGIPATTNQACCVLSGPKSLDIRFIFYWLLVHREPIVSLFSSGGGQPNINRETVTSLRVPAPEQIGQSQIARFLDHETAKIDVLIREQERLIELLQEKRQAVISHAVTKGLDPDVPMKDSGVEWLGEVPMHWGVTRIKFLAEVISKGTTPSTVGAEFTDSGVRFLKAENVGLYDINPEPQFCVSESTHRTLARSSLRAGDILVVIAGATTGRAAVMNSALLPANTNQAVSFIRLQNQKWAEFIQYWISTTFVQNLVLLNSVQSAQPNLSMEDLGDLLLPLPPEDEMRRITSHIEASLFEFAKLECSTKGSSDLLKERRSALISAAVTGKIDVRDWRPPTDESAFDEEVLQAGLETTT